MPIEYSIEPENKLVRVRAHGALTAQDMFSYQRAVWSLPEVAGFDELIDMTDVEEVVYEGQERTRELAALSAGMDSPRPSKLAIVAVRDEHFGLARMYKTLRGLEPQSTHFVQVFRSKEEALAWLGR